jgi:hypothetical protein
VFLARVLGLGADRIALGRRRVALGLALHWPPCSGCWLWSVLVRITSGASTEHGIVGAPELRIPDRGPYSRSIRSMCITPARALAGSRTDDARLSAFSAAGWDTRRRSCRRGRGRARGWRRCCRCCICTVCPSWISGRRWSSSSAPTPRVSAAAMADGQRAPPGRPRPRRRPLRQRQTRRTAKPRSTRR